MRFTRAANIVFVMECLFLAVGAIQLFCTWHMPWFFWTSLVVGLFAWIAALLVARANKDISLGEIVQLKKIVAIGMWLVAAESTTFFGWYTAALYLHWSLDIDVKPIAYCLVIALNFMLINVFLFGRAMRTTANGKS